MKKIALILVVFAFLVNCASTGPSQGKNDQAPDFSLIDVSGNEVRSSDFKGKKNVVLIFYSDNSCSPCISQLGGLQKRISEIEKLDGEVIAFATDGNQNDVESTKRALGITYTLIPTPNSKAVKDFGLSYGAAYATIIIDKDGHIRYKSVDSWNVRTSASIIIKELQLIQ